MREFKNYLLKLRVSFRRWSKKNYPGIYIFIMALIVLDLLHSAGYFSPFFPISINFITLFSMIMLAVLLKVPYQVFYFISIVLLILTFLIKLTLIESWAERGAIYSFEALVVGTLFFLVDSLKKMRIKDK